MRSKIKISEINPTPKSIFESVISVYQPIVNSYKKVEGFEVLARWYENDKIKMPHEFISLISSRENLIALTKVSIDNAIMKINETQGEYFFSINVHHSIAFTDDFVNLCKESIYNLDNIKWISLLILEFSEETDFSNYMMTEVYISELKNLGFRCYLDDCYAYNSVLFPIKRIYFDGYKIDRGFICEISNRKHYNALLQSLVVYCNITGAECIAEGIEDISTFSMLVSLGIDKFQGFLFSEPLSSKDLSDFLMIQDL